MNIKTQGIVLKSFKIADNKRIISIFTKISGKKSFVVYNNSKKNYSVKQFQPLTLINIEFDARQNKNLLNIKEASIYAAYTTIHSSIAKSSIVFFLTEIIDKLIDNEFIDETLFNYFLNSFIFFDHSTDVANFHLSFLIELMHYFGFMPQLNYSEQNKFFNIANANYSENFDKSLCLDQILSKKFFELCNAGLLNNSSIILSQNQRQLLINKIIDYYSYHYKPLNELNSPSVLAYLF